MNLDEEDFQLDSDALAEIMNEEDENDHWADEIDEEEEVVRDIEIPKKDTEDWNKEIQIEYPISKSELTQLLYSSIKQRRGYISIKKLIKSFESLA